MPYSAIEAKEIAKLCTVVDCEHKTAPYVDESDYLVVRTSNVRNGQLVMDGMKFTTMSGYQEWTQRAVPEYGDVLFTREAPAGESCLVPADKRVCMGQRMVMLRPKKDVTDPTFLSLILNTERTKADIARLSIGSTVSRINIADIKKLKIASPPIAEQRKIAKILSTWNKAISTTEHLIDNSKHQKKALMQQLLTGKKRLFNDLGKPFEDEWEEVTLGNTLAKISNGLTYDSKATKGLPVSRIETISTGKVNHQKVGYAPDEEKTRKFKLIKGDILYSHINSLSHIGRVAYFESDKVLYHGMNLLLLRTPTTSDSKFIFYVLSSSIGKAFSKSHAKSAVNQASISTTDIKSFKVNLPTLDEQRKIAAVLTSADKEIGLLEKQLADLKQEKKALMQQLLTGKRRVKTDEEAG